MTKFLIAATDIVTGATVYARTSPTGRTVAFRNGLGLKDALDRHIHLNVNKSSGTPLDGDTACALLITETDRMSKMSSPWIRDLRIVLA